MSLLAAIPLQRIEVLVAAILICVVIFELVRRRHLMERYALLWLLAGIGLMVLALWQGLLTTVSGWVGIYYPPAALFAAGFVFVLAILLQFSIAISRLSDQNKILAQRVALLQQQLEREQAGKAQAEQAENEPNEGLAPRR
ncbi:MAG TPA: DUF2304 domain-containing protein [Solirubrobacterales bacterium]